MIQNAIKILTLGFFISMISGFVLYRTGYFDNDNSSSSMQTSPNGGEILLTTVDQDTNRIPQINQNNQEPIMPSSKSIAPAFDLKKYEQEKKQEILPSSKSMTHPIRINPDSEEVKLENPYMYSSKSMTFPIEVKKTANQISEEARQAYKVQPELEPKPADSARVESPKNPKTKVISNQIKAGVEAEPAVEKVKGISWGSIGMGVLGILFVAIGSIVYFKRKSR